MKCMVTIKDPFLLNIIEQYTDKAWSSTEARECNDFNFEQYEAGK